MTSDNFDEPEAIFFLKKKLTAKEADVLGHRALLHGFDLGQLLWFGALAFKVPIGAIRVRSLSSLLFHINDADVIWWAGRNLAYLLRVDGVKLQQVSSSRRR
ncbi:hypothetical protein [Azospirillum melinis]